MLITFAQQAPHPSVWPAFLVKVKTGSWMRLYLAAIPKYASMSFRHHQLQVAGQNQIAARYNRIQTLGLCKVRIHFAVHKVSKRELQASLFASSLVKIKSQQGTCDCMQSLLSFPLFLPQLTGKQVLAMLVCIVLAEQQ